MAEPGPLTPSRPREESSAGTRVFALTGGIGSGKSSVARLLEAEGVAIVDADRIARQVVQPGNRALAEIADAFGSEMIDASGQLDRKKMGARVFGDEQARAQLNAIVHPRVREAVLDRIQELTRGGARLIGYDIPLLFETRQQDQYRPVVVVYVSVQRQLERVMARDDLDQAQAQARIDSQISLAEKRAQADIVIDNDGPLDQLPGEVRRALSRIESWGAG